MRTLVIGMACLALTACTAAEQKPVSRNGQSLYMENCAACHGDEGRGDGPAAAGLAQKPANLRQIAVRSGGRFPADDVLAKIHGYGGPGHFGDMPDFADEIEGGTVIWITAEGDRIPTPAALAAITRYLESLQDVT